MDTESGRETKLYSEIDLNMRLLLCFVVIGAAVSCGMVASRACLERTRLLNSLADGLTVLKTETCFRMTPMPEALRKAGIQKGSKSFFLGAALALEAGVPLEEAWLQSTSALSALREDDRAQLRFLAAQLGRYDAKTQAERLEACVEALRASVDGVREESRRNAKLSVSLSLVIGLMLAVVLY